MTPEEGPQGVGQLSICGPGKPLSPAHQTGAPTSTCPHADGALHTLVRSVMPGAHPQRGLRALTCVAHSHCLRSFAENLPVLQRLLDFLDADRERNGAGEVRTVEEVTQDCRLCQVCTLQETKSNV